MTPPYGKVDASSKPNGWNEWGNHVLTELKQINERLKALESAQVKTLLQLEGLKVRASLYGAIGGGLIVFLLQLAGEFLLKGGG